MTTTPSSPDTALLTDLSPFVYGTTRLGDDKIDFDQRVRLTRAAMDTGVWFHTSRQYGDALEVLRKAFDEDRASVPKLFFKIGGDDIDALRANIREQLDVLGLDHMDIGQLCIGGGKLAEQYRTGGACYDEFRKAREEGLVHRFVLEVFPWTSKAPLEALEAGYPDGVVDGCIFYLNPLQRFASNPLWDLMQKRNEPMVAMRTVSGGDVHRLRDVPGAAWKDYLQKRAVEVAAIFERSGIKSWCEFCVRFAHSFPQVRTTVGSTSQLDRLRQFIDASTGDIKPLSENIVSDIVRLQYRWSDETDVHAEPWSM